MEQTVEKVRAELEAIAKEMGLPIEDPRVPVEWSKRGGWFNDKIADELIHPLYFTKSKTNDN